MDNNFNENFNDEGMHFFTEDNVQPVPDEKAESFTEHAGNAGCFGNAQDLNTGFSENTENMNGAYYENYGSFTGAQENDQTQYGAGNAEEQQYTYYTYNEAPESEDTKSKKHKKEKVKKEATTGRKWFRVVAMALVFGLISGSIFYGVNYLGNKYIGSSGRSAAVEMPTDGNTANSELISPNGPESTRSMETTAITSDELEADRTSSLTEGTVAEVAAACMPSLVTISEVSVVEMQNMFGQKQTYEAQGAGSGVIVGMNDTELLIATNNHVVNGATSLSVGFIDETTAEALIKGTDSENDLAVIAVKLEDISEETMNNIAIATLGDSDELVLGEQVVAIGNALGYGQSVTSGIVSALDISRTFSDGSGYFESTQLIQTDAPINSGNSGGGLFNMKGELIGINEAKTSMTSSGVTVDGIGYAISISKAEPILRELMEMETREVIPAEERGYLGVTCASVTEDISGSYNMPVGVCFTEVLEGSPAAEAGAKKRDVLTSIDGQTVTTYEELVSYLEGCRAGETVTLTVQRLTEGEYVELELTVTLGTYEVIQSLNR